MSFATPASVSEWWSSFASLPYRLKDCGHSYDATGGGPRGVICPKCPDEGGDHDRRQTGHAGRDYRPLPDLTWRGAKCIKIAVLPVPECAQASAIDSMEALLVAISCPYDRDVYLRNHEIRTKAPAEPGLSRVWRVSTGGCTVCLGTIVLELQRRTNPAAVLLLTGYGVHFDTITFKGGVIICAGGEYAGTFQNCTFERTAVYAVHGASAAFFQCRFHGCQPGLTASGPATHVTLATCAFVRCYCSIIAEEGAAVTAEECEILSSASGVLANDGACMEMVGCVVRGGWKKGGPFGRSVAARNGHVLMRNCAVEWCNLVAYVSGVTACMEATGLRVSDTADGVHLSAGARGALRNSNVQLTRVPDNDCFLSIGASLCVGKGFPACACMQYVRSTFHGGVQTAARVCSGGNLSAVLCEFDCTKDVSGAFGPGGRVSFAWCVASTKNVSIWLDSPSAHARVEGGSYVSDSIVCQAHNGATAICIGCEMSGRCVPSISALVQGAEGAHMHVHRCRLHNGTTGVRGQSGAVMTVTDCHISDMHALLPDDEFGDGVGMAGGGGVVCLGATAKIKGGTVQRCVVGVASQSSSKSGRTGCVHVEGVEFTDCFQGAQLSERCEVHFVHCEFYGLDRELKGAPAFVPRNAERLRSGRGGVSFLDQASGSVRECTFEGYRVGVGAFSNDEVQLRRCRIVGVTEAGRCVHVRGAASIEDCSFTRASRCGVHFHRGGRGSVRRCSFTDMGTGVAIAAESGAIASVLENTTVHNCRQGLLIKDSAQISAQDCVVTGVEDGMMVHGGGCTLTAKRVCVEAHEIGVLGIGRHAAPSHIKLVDCALSGKWGVHVVGNGKHASLLRCTVSRSEVGLRAMGPSSVRVRESSFKKCGEGVVVGDIPGHLEDLCGYCGRSGQAAVRHARAALLRAGGPPADARCPHEGSVARATLVDVKVSECTEAGVRVHLHGHVDARRVTADKCNIGFWVERMVEQSLFRECVALQCKSGMMAWRRVSAEVGVNPDLDWLEGILVVPTFNI